MRDCCSGMQGCPVLSPLGHCSSCLPPGHRSRTALLARIGPFDCRVQPVGSVVHIARWEPCHAGDACVPWPRHSLAGQGAMAALPGASRSPRKWAPVPRPPPHHPRHRPSLPPSAPAVCPANADERGAPTEDGGRGPHGRQGHSAAVRAGGGGGGVGGAGRASVSQCCAVLRGGHRTPERLTRSASSGASSGAE